MARGVGLLRWPLIEGAAKGMSDRTLRGKTAIVGVGETTYYKHGQSPDPELVLVLKAILAA